MTNQSTNRGLLTVAAVMNTFVYAIIVFLIGVLLPTFTDKFGLTDAQKGLLFLVENLAILITILGIGPVMDQFGRKPVLSIGALLIALGVLGMGWAPSFGILLIMVFILGLGGGCNNVGGSTLISDLYPENPGSALNWITSSFGAGAILVPLLGSLLLEPIGQFGYVLILGMVAIIPFVLFIISTFPSSQQAERFDIRNIVNVMTNPLAMTLGFVLFFYVALEVSTAGWLKDFLIGKFAMTDKTSGYVLTGFSAMMVAGRLGGGAILNKVKGTNMVIYCAVVAVAGLVLMILSGHLPVVIIGVVIVGLAFAPIYPTTVGTVGENFTVYRATTIGTVSALGFIGAMLLPYIIGLLGGQLTVMILTAILMVIAQFLVIRFVKSRKVDTVEYQQEAGWE